jgi:hypothetical protein
MISGMKGLRSQGAAQPVPAGSTIVSRKQTAAPIFAAVRNRPDFSSCTIRERHWKEKPERAQATAIDFTYIKNSSTTSLDL